MIHFFVDAIRKNITLNYKSLVAVNRINSFTGVFNRNNSIAFSWTISSSNGLYNPLTQWIIYCSLHSVTYAICKLQSKEIVNGVMTAKQIDRMHRGTKRSQELKKLYFLISFEWNIQIPTKESYSVNSPVVSYICILFTLLILIWFDELLLHY